jgi:hypothetical protein
MGLNGKAFRIGEREFEVPRLRVGPYERALTAISEAEKVDTAADPYGFARLDAFCVAFVELLKEKAPGLTLDEMKELVPMDDLEVIFKQLLEKGGKPKGEVVSP